ncbi:transcriptional regulator with XRE-family HTH domain [Salinibacter ruber]|jgi:transcriptional regulator with XRE-family HTH domain|uniref:LexA family transcriptional regulator n=1 Tax=Salinibacter ruber TaxID=146919 RepID=UPI0021697D19|nr:S24 family peptidase [Salinibacter ruber]MCS3669282.1 transcriptional regulator with XRE-family HTH domain [Salinibacter ruber]MCS3831090.1 transcriptional regulator with XRE-family HTH domain [Salinibacter ruber]
MDEGEAARLKQAREKLGLSRDDAFVRLRMAGKDISFSSYKRWERGERDISRSMATEIIEILQKSEQEIMGDRIEPGGEDLQTVPEIEMEVSDDDSTRGTNSNLMLSRSYIRSEYGIHPERLVVMRVRGRSMLDTLRPGQKVLAVRQEGQDLEDDVIYALRGPLGFTVKRLRFDRKEAGPVIWIWPDNPEQEDQRRCLNLNDFEEEYTVVAKALEVRQKL